MVEGEEEIRNEIENEVEEREGEDIENVIKPARSADFSQINLRRYHTRLLRLNWGPENVHFGKTHIRDPNISARITRRNFFLCCVFHLGT